MTRERPPPVTDFSNERRTSLAEHRANVKKLDPRRFTRYDKVKRERELAEAREQAEKAEKAVKSINPFSLQGL